MKSIRVIHPIKLHAVFRTNFSPKISYFFY